jgi:hypothetical protein
MDRNQFHHFALIESIRVLQIKKFSADNAPALDAFPKILVTTYLISEAIISSFVVT